MVAEHVRSKWRLRGRIMEVRLTHASGLVGNIFYHAWHLGGLRIIGQALSPLGPVNTYFAARGGDGFHPVQGRTARQSRPVAPGQALLKIF